MIIELAKEYYWESPAHYQRWPELLMKFPDVMKERSKNEIAIHYGNFIKDSKGRVHFDEFHNLFGSEPFEKGYKIFGSNMIRQSDIGFVKTAEAKDLEKAYRQGDNWQSLLLEQVLKYSLRFRAIFSALLDSAELHFPSGFMKGYNKAFLKHREIDYHIFSTDKNKVNLNNLMWSDPAITLGSYWMNELNIPADEFIVITGINDREPSLHSMDTWLRNPLYLLKELNLFNEVPGGLYTLNFSEIKKSVSKDLLSSYNAVRDLDEITFLKNLIHEYEEFNGFFPVSIVGRIMKQTFSASDSADIAEWIDRYFMTGIKNGKFSISAYQQGQPRHGRGLLGNLEKQLIKLEF